MAQPVTKSTIKIIKTYDYVDADGALLYQVCRLEPKGFRQRRPNGKGGWINKLDSTPENVTDDPGHLNGRRVLYRLPELLKFPDATIFITEGEKDCDRVCSLGLCATTAASGKWTDDCVKALADRDVFILQDNDDPGKQKALAAAQVLHGTAKTIRVVLLPDLKEGGDVSDWLDADPRHDAEQLSAVCFDAPLWEPTSESVAAVTAVAETTEGKPLPLPFINIVAWRDQPVPEREWTVKDRIPANNVTLLSGEGSVGKSILSLQFATAVVLGRDWLGTMPEPGAGACRVLRRRRQRACGDASI